MIRAIRALVPKKRTHKLSCIQEETDSFLSRPHVIRDDTSEISDSEDMNDMPSAEKIPEDELHTLRNHPNLAVLENTNGILELQTILKDKRTDHSDFVFYADRLMRLVIEEGLNRLPFSEITVTTPTHCPYKGIQFARGNCGVSLCRSGEAMEIALRQCCRSIRIGKILLGEEQRILYARLIADISQRRVLLLYPIVSTGVTTVKAIRALLDARVEEENIYLITLFIAPIGLKRILSTYPSVTVITSEVTAGIPHSFAMKYFGTD